jgi:CspA family cold shock protein
MPIVSKSKELTMTSYDDAGRVSGRVKFFNESKGFGFLVRDDGGDVFVHRTDLRPSMQLFEGQAVTFNVEKTSRGWRAMNIALA